MSTKSEIMAKLHEAATAIVQHADHPQSAEFLQDAFEKAYQDMGYDENSVEKGAFLDLHAYCVEAAGEIAKSADDVDIGATLWPAFEETFAKLADGGAAVDGEIYKGADGDVIAKANAEPPIVGETQWRWMRRVCKNDTGVRALDEVTKGALAATYNAHVARRDGPVLAADALTAQAQAIVKSALDRGQSMTFEKAYTIACRRRPDLYVSLREQQAVTAAPIAKSANVEIAKAVAEGQLNAIAKSMEGQPGKNGKPMSFFQAFATAAAANPELYKASRGLTNHASATGNVGSDALIDEKDEGAGDAGDGQLEEYEDLQNVDTENVGHRDGRTANARTAGSALRKMQTANDELLRLAGEIRKSRPGMTATQALSAAYQQRDDLYQIAKGRR